MNEIPIEYDGYEFSTKVTDAPSTYHFKGQVEFNGAIMNIEFGYEIDGKSFSGYRVNYKDKTLYINDEFMRERSETYVKINRIWRTFSSDYINFGGNSEIMAVYPFDDLLFVVTNGVIGNIVRTQVIGTIPITLYILDWGSEQVYYAGYFQDYSEPDRFLSIVKK